MKRSFVIIIIMSVLFPALNSYAESLHSECANADSIPFVHTESLFDESDANALGLSVVAGTEMITVFAPTDDSDHFCNGVVMTSFKGNLYCMWQSSQSDEDAADTKWSIVAASTTGILGVCQQCWLQHYPMVIAHQAGGMLRPTL